MHTCHLPNNCDVRSAISAFEQINSQHYPTSSLSYPSNNVMTITVSLPCISYWQILALPAVSPSYSRWDSTTTAAGWSAYWWPKMATSAGSSTPSTPAGTRKCHLVATRVTSGAGSDPVVTHASSQHECILNVHDMMLYEIYSLFTQRKPHSLLKINGERGFLRVDRLSMESEVFLEWIEHGQRPIMARDHLTIPEVITVN